MPSVTAELSSEAVEAFLSVSFNHQIVKLSSKCKTLEERLFYMVQAASQ